MAEGYTEDNNVLGIDIAMQRWLCFGRRCGLGNDGKSFKRQRKCMDSRRKNSNKIVRHNARMTSYRFVYGENANEVEWKVINIRIDNSTGRTSNCTELAPVGCNTQTLEALK